MAILGVSSLPAVPPEPWGRLRGCVRAGGPEEAAAVSQLPLVPGARLPRDAHLQQHHHLWRGEGIILSVFS